MGNCPSFLFLAALIEGQPLFTFADGSTTSSGFAITLASLLVLGPGAAAAIAVFTSLFYDLLRRKHPHNLLFNMAMFPIIILLAGLTYKFLSFGTTYLDLLPNFPALLATILVLNLSNYFIFGLSMVFEYGFSLREVWEKYFKPFIHFDFLFAPLGILLAIVYHFLPLAIIFFFLPFVMVYLLFSFQKRLKRSEEQAIKDELTGFYNRRFFNEQLEITLSQAKREGKNLSLIILDLNNFKKFNDTYGYPEGDRALKELGEIILKTSRKSDIPVRYGGEEFALILPDTPRPGALLVAERLRKTVEEAKLSEESHSLTVSLGISTYPEDA